MKLRIKTLLDSIRDLETELNRNYDRFKQYIQSSNLPEDMKKNILSHVEGLLKPNISSRLNLGELKDLLLNDSDIYRDPLFKNIIGGDLGSLTRQVKRDEQIRKAKTSKNKAYDPEFDSNNLEEDQKIITRKVLKVIERKNSKGDWVFEEVEVEEEVVIDVKTGLEIRKRNKPQPQTQQSQGIKNFMDQHGGFAVGGSKITLPKIPVAKDGQEAKEG